MSENGLRVVELRTENFMGIKLAELRPGPDGLVIIGGRNGAGKTSLLDSFECAIRGKKFHPDRPVRDGAEKSDVTLDLGELKIRRRFKPDGSGTFHVETADGMVPRKPQEMLDALAGAIAFDPLEFSRMEPKARLELVRKLAGVDVSDLDKQRAALYEERTGVNHEAKVLAGQLEGMPRHEGVPDEEVSVNALLQHLDELRGEIGANDTKRAAMDDARSIVAERMRERVEWRDAVENMERQLEEARERLSAAVEAERQATDDADALQATLNDLVDPDPAPIEEQIKTASTTNQLVRDNAARVKRAAELRAVKDRSEQMTGQLQAIDSQKAARIASASLPLDGLSFGDDGVTLNGIPFAQISSAEQLRASVAMGIALNPKLHVMLIRDGSLLDADSMGLLAEMAAEHGYQCFIERVGNADQGAIIIEAGEVVGAERPAVDAA